MTASTEYLKVTFGFTANLSDEIAVTSLNFATSEGAAFDAEGAFDGLDWDVTGLVLGSEMLSLMNTATLGWALYSRFRTIRIAAVDTTGLEFPDKHAIVELATVNNGSTDQVPPQCTCVLSLRSGSSTGGANFGRMFLPHTKPTQGAGDPVMTTAAQTAIVNASQTFVNAANDTMADATAVAGLRAHIISQKTGVTAKPVLDVGIGRVIDTQRRRRNSLNEATILRSIP